VTTVQSGRPALPAETSAAENACLGVPFDVADGAPDSIQVGPAPDLGRLPRPAALRYEQFRTVDPDEVHQFFTDDTRSIWHQDIFDREPAAHLGVLVLHTARGASFAGACRRRCR
jgi:hypothetical protein